MENEKKDLEQKQKRPTATRGKKNVVNQSSVLKQLNNQSLYPLKERIGIYIIATFACFGLILITYTGVMAFVTGTTLTSNGSEQPVEIDAMEISDILDDIADILDDIDEANQPATQSADDMHEYATEPDTTDAGADPTTTEPEDEDELPTDSVNSEDETDDTEDDNDDDAPTGGSSAFTSGVVSSSFTSFHDLLGGPALTNIFEGHAVEILDWDYSPYWAQIRTETEFGSRTGFVEKENITPN